MAGDGPDRHDLYELCVQSPGDMAILLRAIHGGTPRVLGEDFCGTAAVSRAWVRLVGGGRAVGTDVSGEVLARAREAADAGGASGADAALELVRQDVLEARHRADVIFAGNFSIGEIHERERLVAYLRRCRERLLEGGVFVCDTYGGESAFVTGEVHRMHRGPAGERVRYTWEQREADPLRGMVVNALHFRIEHRGRIVAELRDAFVYHWRLWSVPELRDAMGEAGFGVVEVFEKRPDAVDEQGNAHVLAVRHGAELEESFDVCVAAWA